MKLLIHIHRLILVRRRLYKLNRFLYSLALRGVGILNYENHRVSGERLFLQRMCEHRKGFLVLDVGANIGAYSCLVRELDATARIIAFEPHPSSYSSLLVVANRLGFHAVNSALGDEKGEMLLFDYADQGGSQHASLYRSVIEDIHQSASRATSVEVLTLDEYVKSEGLEKIGLLKIDAEGHELKVLMGARQSIRDCLIEVIHFEFNEMNAVSRAFMRDFWDVLPDYRFYRMYPDGLLEIRTYSIFDCEIFAFQNIVAVHTSSSLHSAL